MEETVVVSKKDKVVKGKIDLTTSKSISNRALLIQALAQNPFKIDNLAAADDTVLMQRLLQQIKAGNGGIVDAGPAGTVYRFLTALLSITPGTWTLTGSERMKQRPVKLLVDALRTLGADIKYLEQDGYPPISVSGNSLKENRVSIDGGVSSQYITALLLIAPVLPNGLLLEIEGELASRPYVNMTLEMMRYFGAEVDFTGDTIVVKPKAYNGKDFKVEADWSSASYWYLCAVLANEADIELSGLYKESLQGDAEIVDIMTCFGVETTYTSTGIRITKNSNFTKPVQFEWDFTHCPDLAQTVAVVCAASGIPSLLKGLHSLKIKETDRVAALITELGKFDANITESSFNVLSIQSSQLKQATGVVNTYHDHRMALAFAPLALLVPGVSIENREVVGKSYPDYWNDLASVGFVIE